MTDKLDLAGLRAKAEAATPGPWIRSGVRQKLPDTDCDCIMVGPDKFLIAGLPIGRDHAGAFRDAAFIAAFDPPTALALLDEIVSLRAALEAEGEWLCSECGLSAPERFRVFGRCYVCAARQSVERRERKIKSLQARANTAEAALEAAEGERAK